ncbi:hypothetical protein BJ944DRAFT_241251 [Cunninghamella echinulata]|nr:hypothetical protein BJ944DRAFT_241251 [Cunninghamella echinulata]
MISLRELLSSQSLEIYYQPLLDAGVIDQDLPELLNLTDEDLTELLQAIHMLPFHAIKLKKAIRDMRSITKEFTPTTTAIIKKTNTTDLSLLTSTDIMKKDMSQDIIVSHATIYGKNTKRKLTNYEQAINQASVELALQDPSLLIQKGKLFDMAKKKLLEEGYCYKRGKSRSKLITHSKLPKTRNTYPSSSINSSLLKDSNNNDNNQNIIAKKHQKRSDKAQKQSEKRLQLIQKLELQIRQMRQAIKNKPINKSSSSQELHHREELIKSKKCLSVEVSKLKAQERKHQWYKRKCQNKTNKLSMELDEDDDELKDEENEDENEEKKKEKEKMIDHYPIQSTTHLPRSPPISPTHCSNSYLPPITSNPLSPSSTSSFSSSVSLPSPSLSTSSLSTSPLASPTSHLLPIPSYYYLPPLISKHHHHRHQHDHSLYSTSVSNTPSIRESDVRGKALSVKDFCT